MGREPTPLPIIFLATLTFTVALLVAVTGLWLQPVRIASESMIPTLEACTGCANNEWVLVNLRAKNTATRGDIVQFNGLAAWGPDFDSKRLPESSGEVVKRVIGVPGDTVACCTDKNQVTINGKPLNEPYLAGLNTNVPITPRMLGRDEFFVMGDNRANSWDSRKLGPIREAAVTGKVVASVWPLQQTGTTEWVPKGSGEQVIATG